MMLTSRTITPALKTMLVGTSALIFFTGTHPANAQVENASRIADPARISQELMSVDELPELQSKIEVKDIVLQNAPEGADKITFALQTIELDGVSAYGAEDLDPLYQDKIGAVVTLADIYALSNTLTKKYRNDGYILTQVVVPPQTIEDGKVRLRVVEGFIDKIIIEGEEKESAAQKIRDYAENLRKDGILNAKRLEHFLLLINDLPGVTARNILSPSKTTPGASDLTIMIERDYYEAEISFDNHGSRYLGPYQGMFRDSLNSYFGLNERISGQFVMSGDKDDANELLFGAVSYEQPISYLGTKIRVQASHTSTEPGYDLDEFDVKGKSQFLSLGVTHPFVRSRTTNILARASIDLRDVNSKNNLEPSREDHIRSLRLGTTLQFMDTLFGVGVNAFDLEISKGLGVFGASDKNDTNLTRSLGDPQYTKAKLQAQRLQRLGSSVNLLMAGSAQWSANPLLSSEEFGVGGQSFGRGYDSSEIVGEDGIAGKLELQWKKPYDIRHIQDYQLYGFFDTGTVWNQDATTSADKRNSLSSTGLGFRADITDNAKAGFSVAFPLTRDVDTTNDRGPRYYFNLSYKF